MTSAPPRYTIASFSPLPLGFLNLIEIRSCVLTITYYLLNHQIIDLLYATLILENRQLLRMRASKVVAAYIYNELQAVSLFLALDGASMHTDPFTSGKKYLS